MLTTLCSILAKINATADLRHLRQCKCYDDGNGIFGSGKVDRKTKHYRICYWGQGSEQGVEICFCCLNRLSNRYLCRTMILVWIKFNSRISQFHLWLCLHLRQCECYDQLDNKKYFQNRYRNIDTTIQDPFA